MAELIKLDLSNALDTPERKASFEAMIPEADRALQSLFDGTGEGNDFLGWLDLPTSITYSFLDDIRATAEALRKDCEFVVSVGIGGSYLGIKSTIEALRDSFDAYKGLDTSKLLYAGNQISEDYLYELLDLLRGKKFGIINISKSGTTTEPAIAFRLLKNLLEEQEGREFAKEHIVAITDEKKGALRTLADKEGYKTFVIPDNVGGRFTVLTPVGLLPIAVAGLDIKQLVQGAQDMEEATSLKVSPDTNPSLRYAAARNVLYREGKKIEILANFSPKLQYVGEWFKQLFAESEGKDGLAIFPASANFTTDLHSIGQLIQQGERNLFETVLSVGKTWHQVLLPEDKENLDGLNYLSAKRIDFVNKQAETGTLLAHVDGGVPNIRISLPELNAYYLGQLYYFFEKAVGISGYLLGVNPFNQPGVEDYKGNMFALLGKPGYEEASKAIQTRLGKGL